MTVINQVMVEMINIVVRNLGTGTSTPTSTPFAQPAETSASPTPTQSNGNSSSTGNTTQSPLLFFVALGFGVVFTNLWIIVGVKYCFRYNARNRALARGEDGEPINLENIPRTHRRRREKKLMSMDEVNERFPLTKYKSWVATRASEGLPTAGGVTVSASRAASLREADGVIPTSPTGTKHSVENRPATATSVVATSETPTSPAAKAVEGSAESKQSSEAVEKAHVSTEVALQMPPVTEVPTTATVDTGKADDEDDEDEDHIHDALPPELLTTPGDSCAICIDTIEDDDDIRGLTCGHAFHAGCLDPWLTSRRACCPLCKADYYIPKPRPEGEAAEPERPRRTGRMNMPAQPGSAWTGIRGNPRLMFPGRFMSSPMYLGDGYNAQQVDRRSPRQQRRAAAAAARQAQSLEAVHATEGAAANPSGSFAARIGSANPFRAGWMPPMRFPGRSRREQQNPTPQEGANPEPAPLQEVVIRQNPS